MHDNNSQILPDDRTLSNYLEILFFNHVPSWKGFRLVQREVGFSSTFQAEVVKCSFENAPDISIRCKYLIGNENDQEGGHRGGVEYEARIYNERLKKLPLSLVDFYGSFYISSHNIFCLVIKNIDDCIRIDKSLETDPLSKSAAWIATFHKINKHRKPTFEKVYDEEYYCVWVNNTLSRGALIKSDHPWIYQPCEYFINKINSVLSFPTTLIHGEFYPHNILLNGTEIYPIDWESAAIAFGEIDLAALIENWSEVHSEKAINTYKSILWPNMNLHEEKQFEERLKLAKIYLHLRWIGTHSDFELWKGRPTRFEKFYKRLELFKKLNRELEYS